MKLQISLTFPDDLADLSDEDIQLAHDRVSSHKNKADLLNAGIMLATVSPLFLIAIFRHTMTNSIFIILLFLALVVMSLLGGMAQKYFAFKLLIKEMRKIQKSNQLIDPTWTTPVE